MARVTVNSVSIDEDDNFLYVFIWTSEKDRIVLKANATVRLNTGFIKRHPELAWKAVELSIGSKSR